MSVDNFSQTSSGPGWERGAGIEGGGGEHLQLGLTVLYFVFREIQKCAKQVTVLPSSDHFAKLVLYAFLENTKYEIGNCQP